MDIFKDLGITDSQGNQMSENNVNPLMGYRIVHRDTGRIMPHTQRNEVMGADYAMHRLATVANDYMERKLDFPFGEYTFEPMYMSELDDIVPEYILLYTDKDHKNFGLFK